MSTEKYSIDLKLHMTVKTLAILQGEINCKIDELVKKTQKLKEKEEEAEITDFLLEMISNNLGELEGLIYQRNNLRNQIENLEKTELDLVKE